MARVTCAISGLPIACPEFENLMIPHTEGYVHPIFATSEYHLKRLYTKHCQGELTAKESYLLFLALVQSTGCIKWRCPAKLDPESPKTIALVESNLKQLLAVIHKTSLILHPKFKQPDYVVTQDSANLACIPSWIKSWNTNIEWFYSKRATDEEIEKLKRLENKLTHHIYSGESPARFARVIANWADKAAEFPDDKRVLYKETIVNCFSSTKMFNTPLALLRELKDFIECNIEVGSIHFHTLSEVLVGGIAKHTDYLGGSSLALGYSLLPSLDDSTGETLKPERPKISEAETKAAADLALIIANAPKELPKREDYASSLEFIKAKLAYRNYTIARDKAAEQAEKLAKAVTFVDSVEPTDNLPDQEDLESDELETYSLDEMEDLDGLTILSEEDM